MQAVKRLGLYISVVAVVVAGVMGIPASAAACRTPAPKTAEGWRNLVVDTPFNGRWYHADAGRSLRLPDGRHLWVFGDTLSGTVSPDGTQNWGNQFIHNRALITDKGCVTQLIGPNRADGHPTDWIPIEKGNDIPGVDDFYWPGELFMDGAHLRMFLVHVAGNGSDFVVRGMDIATFDVSGAKPKLLNIKPTPATAPEHPAWGASVLQNGLYTYVYGNIHKKETWVFGHYQYVARVLKTQAATPSAWRFWNGTSWVADQSAAVAVISGHEGIGAGTVMYPRPGGGYALVAKQYEFIGSEIVAWTSPSVMGPWTKVTPAVVSPVPNLNADEISYSAFAHPQIPLASGKLLVSWARSTFDASQFGSPRYALDFAEVTQP